MDRHALINRFGERWDDEDRAIVNRVLDTLQITDLRERSQDVEGWREGDPVRVIAIRKGTIYVRPDVALLVGAAPDATSGEDCVIRLLTHTPTGGSKKPELRGDVCPSCGMEMPLTGQCDDCGVVTK